MGDKFDFAYAFTKKWEGGWTNHPADPGGPTDYGLTLETLRDDYSKRDPQFFKSIGVQLPITVQVLKAMTPAQAEAIFERFYWAPHDLDDYLIKTAAFLFDCGVNHGWGNAVKLAQRGINNSGVGKLTVDSKMGPLTKSALLGAADGAAFLRACCDAREKFYRDIVANKPSQKVFLQGWLNRVNDQRKYLGAA